MPRMKGELVATFCSLLESCTLFKFNNAYKKCCQVFAAPRLCSRVSVLCSCASSVCVCTFFVFQVVWSSPEFKQLVSEPVGEGAIVPR